VTPLKSQRSKFKAEKSRQVGASMCYERLYSRAFVGSPQSTHPITTIFVTSGNPTDIINRATFHIDRLRGFGLAGTRKSYVCIGKHGRP
jgi:hypothetical protein